MSDEELLEMYEREWKSLMDKVNEIEENIVQTRLRIEKRNAAQQSVRPTSEAESQIDEDWSNDNDRISDGLSRFTRG